MKLKKKKEILAISLAIILISILYYGIFTNNDIITIVANISLSIFIILMAFGLFGPLTK